VVKPFHPQQYHPLYLDCGCWVIRSTAGKMWDVRDRQVTEEEVRAHAKEHLARG
jgi:hypothetical protein